MPWTEPFLSPFGTVLSCCLIRTVTYSAAGLLRSQSEPGLTESEVVERARTIFKFLKEIENKELKRLLTPEAYARVWAIAQRSEIIDTGQYSLWLALDADAQTAVKTQADQLVKATFGWRAVKRTWPIWKLTAPTDNKPADAYIDLKARAWQPDGTKWQVPLYDANGLHVQQRVFLGPGSGVRTRGTMRTYRGDYDRPAVTFDLDAIQIVRLVERRPNQDSLPSPFAPVEDDPDAFDCRTFQRDWEPPDH